MSIAMDEMLVHARRHARIRDRIFMRQRVFVRIDVNLLDVELPYRHDLSVILEKMSMISTAKKTLLYEMVYLAFTVYGYERARDLIFTHGCWEFTNEEVSRLLREAIVERNLNMVNFLLQLNPDLEASGIRYASALWAALTYQCENIAKVLIEAGANVNETSEELWECGKTPILYAMSVNFSDEFIDLMIEHGANINATAEQLQSSLAYAMISGEVYVIKRVLNYGARIDFKDSDGRTLLHMACRNLCVVEILPVLLPLLLQHNIDVNAKDAMGANALYYLISQTHYQPNYRDYYGLDDAVKLLLRSGVSLVVGKINNRLTPLQMALQEEDETMAFVYLRYFAKFIVIDNGLCDEEKESIRLYPRYWTYFEACLEEFQRMKETEIYNHIKFSCIFSKSIKELTLTLNLVRIQDFLKRYKKFKLPKLFPTLQPYIKNTMTIVTKNCKLFKSTEKKLTPIFRKRLPILAIKKIAYYAAVDKIQLI